MGHRWQDPFRGLERRLKVLTIRVLRRLMRPAPSQLPPDWRARPHRILYLRYDRIGDMVLATGIFAAIRAAQPTVTVDVLASIGNAAVLDGNPDVGTVYRINKAHPWTFLITLWRVRRVHYDAVVDGIVMAASLTSMLLMWASGAQHRIGIGDRGNAFALTLPLERLAGAVHHVEHSASLLAAFEQKPRPGSHAAPEAPIGSPPWRPRLFPSAEELAEAQARWRFAEGRGAMSRPGGGRLLVNVSAGAPCRYWPEGRLVEAIRWVRSCFPQVILLLVGVVQDWRRMQRIGAHAGVLAARTPRYRQMMALVATCDFAFTPDTSVTHIASAFGKPMVGLFERGKGGLCGPYGTASYVVSAPAHTLASLASTPVLQALEMLLSRPVPAPPPVPVESIPVDGLIARLDQRWAEAPVGLERDAVEH